MTPDCCTQAAVVAQVLTPNCPVMHDSLNKARVNIFRNYSEM